MSSQSFRKKTRIVMRNLDLKFIQSQQKTHHKTFQKNKITYLNSSKNCMACGHDCSFDIETKRQIPLEKHHETYFPQRIAFVHQECHFAIHHKGLRPDLIKYPEGDGKKFYDQQKQSSKENTWSVSV
jgi:hypothetical protein